MRLAYLGSFLFIITWWFLGFSSQQTSSKNLTLVSAKISAFQNSTELFINPLSRSKIKKALDGDSISMIEQIKEWDQDAQILESRGLILAEKLSRKDFIQALTLARKLEQETSAVNSNKKYLPQTWVSARFLMSLVTPAEISFLPRGFKKRFSNDEQIKRFDLPELKGELAEMLWKSSPTLAFTAPYSNPGTIETFKRLHIPYHFSDHLNSLDAILNEIKTVGKLVEKKDKAELLTLFIRSALYAIDNHVKLISPSQDVCYLSCGLHYSVPTTKTITGQLVKRLGINKKLSFDHSAAWKIPLDQEQIMQLKPARFIIACEKPEKFILPSWPLSAVVILVNETLLESPDQYLVLAYFDLFEALCTNP